MSMTSFDEKPRTRVHIYDGAPRCNGRHSRILPKLLVMCKLAIRRAWACGLMIAVRLGVASAAPMHF